MLSCAPKPKRAGRIQKGSVNNPKTDGFMLARPPRTAVAAITIIQNNNTRVIIRNFIFQYISLCRSLFTLKLLRSLLQKCDRSFFFVFVLALATEQHCLAIQTLGQG